jgi:hypothetical protein
MGGLTSFSWASSTKGYWHFLLSDHLPKIFRIGESRQCPSLSMSFASRTVFFLRCPSEGVWSPMNHIYSGKRSAFPNNERFAVTKITHSNVGLCEPRYEIRTE